MFIAPSSNKAIPENWYNATIMDYELQENDDRPDWSPSIRWTFNLGRVSDVDGDVDERTLTAYSSQILSAKSKLWAWAKCAGLDPSKGLDLDHMKGRQVAIEVVIKTNEEGERFNKVTNLSRPMPAQNGQPQQAPPQPAMADSMPAVEGEEVPW